MRRVLQACGHEGSGVNAYENGCYVNANDENDDGVKSIAVWIANASGNETVSNDAG